MKPHLNPTLARRYTAGTKASNPQAEVVQAPQSQKGPKVYKFPRPLRKKALPDSRKE